MNTLPKQSTVDTSSIDDTLLAHKNLDSLVFEGGGVLGTAYVGVAQILADKRLAKQCKNNAGASIGSVIATLRACGASAEFMEKKIRGLDYLRFEDCSMGSVGAAYNLYMHYGLYKGHEYEQFVEDCFYELTGIHNITYKQIHDIYGGDLIVVATNISKRRRELFNWKTTPDLAASRGCRMSGSVPFLFEPVLHNGDLYWDGGVIDDYPLDVLRCDLETGKEKPFDSVLGFKLVSDREYKHQDPPPINGVTDLFKAGLSLISHQLMLNYVHPSDIKRTVMIDIGNRSSLNFASVTEKDKDEMIEAGRSALTKFLKEKEDNFKKKL